MKRINYDTIVSISPQTVEFIHLVYYVLELEYMIALQIKMYKTPEAFSSYHRRNCAEIN